MNDNGAWSDFSAERMLRAFERACGQALDLAPGLADALTLAWRASLQLDEGRSPSFAIAFGPQGRPSDRAKCFEPPVRIDDDPRRLARLARATDPWRIALHVRQSDSGVLEATALAPMPDLPSWTDQAGRLVGIEVTAPGRISLFGREVAVFYEDGRLATQARGEAEAVAVNDDAVEALLAHGAEPVAAGHRIRFDRFSEPLDMLAWELHAQLVRHEAVRIARSVLHEDVRHLAFAIRQRGHGGAVLLLPRDASLADPDVRELFSGEPHAFAVESRVSTAGWNGDLLATFTWRLHVALAGDHGLSVLAPDALSFLHGRDEKVPLAQWLQSHGRLRLPQVEAAWRSAAARVADLCQLDGAVVASVLHEPLAIGAFLRLGAEEEETRASATNWSARRGTRHRSMHHVVGALPGSAGLVVSHDGDATVYRHGRAPAPLHLF